MNKLWKKSICFDVLEGFSIWDDVCFSIALSNLQQICNLNVLGKPETTSARLYVDYNIRVSSFLDKSAVH